MCSHLRADQPGGSQGAQRGRCEKNWTSLAGSASPLREKHVLTRSGSCPLDGLGGCTGHTSRDTLSVNLVGSGLQAADTILSAANPRFAELNGLLALTLESSAGLPGQGAPPRPW